MYIIIEKNSNKAWHFKEKTKVCQLIGISTKTLLRNQNKLPKEWNEYIVYHSESSGYKSNRGGNREGYKNF